MRVLGVIPARGGSKVVPRKNVRLLGGKPLVSYMIKAALSSGIDRTIVSTDDPEIAAVAREHGAEVPFMRPKELATDTASSLSVLLHALRHVEKGGYMADAVAFLQPTSPFCTNRQIDAAIGMLDGSDADSVVGVCESKFHPYFMYRMDGENNLSEMIRMEDKPLRKQDVPTFFRLTDAPMVSRRRYFETVNDRSPCFNPESMKGVVMEGVSSTDIDDELDFLYAEFIIKEGLFKQDG